MSMAVFWFVTLEHSSSLAASVTLNYSWLTMPVRLDVANDAVYLIGSTVFQCMENH
jgi:hypothetical protein